MLIDNVQQMDFFVFTRQNWLSFSDGPQCSRPHKQKHLFLSEKCSIANDELWKCEKGIWQGAKTKFLGNKKGDKLKCSKCFNIPWRQFQAFWVTQRILRVGWLKVMLHSSIKARARDLKFVDFLMKHTVTRIWRRDALNDLYRKVTYVCVHAHVKHQPTNEQSNVKNVCLKSVIKIIKRTMSMNSCNLHSEHKVLMLHILRWRIIWKERKQFASHCTYSFPPASIVILRRQEIFSQKSWMRKLERVQGGKGKGENRL